jgi:hypothetical protein
MREHDLNRMMSTVSDPICNVYKIESKKDSDEIQRMMRIFAIANEQRSATKAFAIRTIIPLKVVLSNN